jgi:hypothetical protein
LFLSHKTGENETEMRSLYCLMLVCDCLAVCRRDEHFYNVSGRTVPKWTLIDANQA